MAVMRHARPLPVQYTLRRAATGLCALLATWATSAGAVPTPQGGCPQPQHTLVASEFHVGAGLKPRWLEIVNPGKEELSLENVVVRITAKGVGGGGANPDVIEFIIDGTAKTLPAGVRLVVGHVPGYDPSKGGLGFQLIDLGANFQLPICATKVQILGPKGVIDTITWDLCPVEGEPLAALWQTVLSLNPAHLDICLNDDPKHWCTASSDGIAVPTPGKPNAWGDLDGDGFTQATGDCNDSDKAIGPTGFEFCNGIDDNCSGQTDENVAAPLGTCLSFGVCSGPLDDGSPVAQCKGSDGWVCTYPSTFQSINETGKCDGLDNDCDGETDEGVQNACGNCLPPSALVEVCDGKDNDCDGETDEQVDLSKVICGGIGVCQTAVAACDPVKGPACALPPAYEATEVSCDGKDNDCDGETDEELGLGQTCDVGTGECTGSGTLQCAPGGKVTCNAEVGSPGKEICGDGRDNDCDGATDEGFHVGEQCSFGLGICRAQGKYVCTADGGNATCTARPGAAAEAEFCGNGLDDDCDGHTDESGCIESGGGSGLTDCGAAPTSSLPWPALTLLCCAVVALLRQRKLPG